MKILFWKVVYQIYTPKTIEGKCLKMVRLGLIDGYISQNGTWLK